MPTTTSITTTYAGESAGRYISAALLSANTIENGGLTVIPNIKFKQVVKRFAMGNSTQDANCDFTPTSSVTLTERVLQPKELEINMQLCRKDFRSDWEAISMGYSAFDTLPKSFADYLIAYVANLTAQDTENSIWKGTGTAGSGTFQGFESLLTGVTLPAGQDLTVVAGGIVNESNVKQELGRIVDAIPSRLYGNENLKIYVPQNIMRAYIRLLGGFTSGIGASGVNNQGSQWFNGNTNALTFDGVPLFMCNGMSSNKAIATTTDNLMFGTGLLSDFNEVKVIDMGNIDGSQNVRVVMRYTAGVQYGVTEDIVVYNI